ncbi:flagellar biosynthetic protein FliO [Rhizobium sp. SSA_523]|uniref:flagellar biosynthetic protein FliO n=1 Tax=Rhizobium sp. SSA_523 TaxID=2952477 RepID=UPI0020916A8D|nr:flagellar biosynthetic protein FliO [Rhizobium sp. SSA_523]MCO5729978.1 flagellar biosynthetic protein FliO [Rhizobium sp. SSA_523]WKC25055.1 flagellar biosynthetic protein FliO [Rhizobium sp. SSA_523]
MFEDLMSDYGSRLLIAVAGVGLGLVCLFVVLMLLRRRRGPAPFLRGGKNRQPRLQVLDAAAVDARRRIVLIRRDEVEHLVMIGGPTDVVIESGIGGQAYQAQTYQTHEGQIHQGGQQGLPQPKPSEQLQAPAEPVRLDRPLQPAQLSAPQADAPVDLPASAAASAASLASTPSPSLASTPSPVPSPAPASIPVTAKSSARASAPVLAAGPASGLAAREPVREVARETAREMTRQAAGIGSGAATSAPSAPAERIQAPVAPALEPTFEPTLEPIAKPASEPVPSVDADLPKPVEAAEMQPPAPRIDLDEPRPEPARVTPAAAQRPAMAAQPAPRPAGPTRSEPFVSTTTARLEPRLAGDGGPEIDIDPPAESVAAPQPAPAPQAARLPEHATPDIGAASDALDAARRRVFQPALDRTPEAPIRTPEEFDRVTPAASPSGHLTAQPVSLRGSDSSTPAGQAARPHMLGSDFDRILEEEMAQNLAGDPPTAMPRPGGLQGRREPAAPRLTGATPEPSLQQEVARIFGEMSVTREDRT